jgi:hypothetical protein
MALAVAPSAGFMARMNFSASSGDGRQRSSLTWQNCVWVKTGSAAASSSDSIPGGILGCG